MGPARRAASVLQDDVKLKDEEHGRIISFCAAEGMILTTCLVIYYCIYDQSRTQLQVSHQKRDRFKDLPVPCTGQQERHTRTHRRVFDYSADQDRDGSGGERHRVDALDKPSLVHLDSGLYCR